MFLKRLMFLEMFFFFKKMGMESAFMEEIVLFSIVFNQYLAFQINEVISPSTVCTQISQDVIFPLALLNIEQLPCCDNILGNFDPKP